MNIDQAKSKAAKIIGVPKNKLQMRYDPSALLADQKPTLEQVKSATDRKEKERLRGLRLFCRCEIAEFKSGPLLPHYLIHSQGDNWQEAIDDLEKKAARR